MLRGLRRYRRKKGYFAVDFWPKNPEKQHVFAGKVTQKKKIAICHFFFFSLESQWTCFFLIFIEKSPKETFESGQDTDQFFFLFKNSCRCVVRTFQHGNEEKSFLPQRKVKIMTACRPHPLKQRCKSFLNITLFTQQVDNIFKNVKNIYDSSLSDASWMSNTSLASLSSLS